MTAAISTTRPMVEPPDNRREFGNICTLLGILIKPTTKSSHCDWRPSVASQVYHRTGSEAGGAILVAAAIRND